MGFVGIPGVHASARKERRAEGGGYKWPSLRPGKAIYVIHLRYYG